MVGSIRRRARLSCLVLLSLWLSVPGYGEIAAADLNTIRTVSEGDWLRQRMEVLGLRLSYPAYRVDIGLVDADQAQVGISFMFWLSAPMSQHLQDAGRGETEKVLTYHARGIANQIGQLLQEEFPELWLRYDPEEDVGGLFLTPGDGLDAPPRDLASWQGGRLKWTYVDASR
ncbi:hypothetical protein ACFL6X_00505 [Candidatus Latescibacterota bacterium]